MIEKLWEVKPYIYTTGIQATHVQRTTRNVVPTATADEIPVGFVEMRDIKCLIVKLSNLEQASHNIESLKQRLKGLCECIESSMHAHGDSHKFSKLRIPGCL